MRSLDCDPRHRQSARSPRIRSRLQRPNLRLRADDAGVDRVRRLPLFPRRESGGCQRGRQSRSCFAPPAWAGQRSGRLRPSISAHSRIRGRLRRDDRHRSDLQRRNGVQATGAKKCGNHAWLDGHHSRRVLSRHQPAGPPLRNHADDDRYGSVPTCRSHLRPRRGLLRVPVQHVRDPGAGGEHCVRRFPATLRNSRQRWLHAEAAGGAR